MNIIISILAIYGLAFYIKQASGPFNIMDRLRNYLMRNKYVGVQFYKLLSCYFCLGCQCGWIIYLLTSESYKLGSFVVWVFAGGVIGLIFDGLMSRLYQADQTIKD